MGAAALPAKSLARALHGATPTLMLPYSFLLLQALALMVPPAAEELPAPARVAELIARALVAENFAGAQIEDVLLGEPETKGADFQYYSEFTVREKGKTKRCEDWRFKLKKAQRTWYVSEIARGRCSG